MGISLNSDGFFIVKGALTGAECQDLIDFFNSNESIDAAFYSGKDNKKVDYKTRKSDLVWIEKDRLTWIHSRINYLTGGRELTDRLQLTRYQLGDHFTWHPDYVKGVNERSLSMSIILNSAFAGGEFELKDYGSVELRTGDAIFFDSKKWHRVSPVILGERYSLVGWFR